MDLLNAALETHPAPYWTKELKLARNTLHTAKTRGHISPAIAGALAEKLGKNVKEWIVIAALESEKDSACKSHLIKRLRSLSDVI
jgi:alpha-L-arabinofuranosidase